MSQNIGLVDVGRYAWTYANVRNKETSRICILQLSLLVKQVAKVKWIKLIKVI